MIRFDRHLLIAVAVLALCACATVDPNLKTLTDSDQAQQRAALEAQALQASERSKSVLACANSEHTESCMLGLVAAELAANTGSRAAAPPRRDYQRPPTFLEQVGGLAAGLAPWANAFVTFDATRQNARTQREMARINADREIAVTQAWAGTTTGVAHEIAGMPPGYSAGGDVVLGDKTTTTVGGDQVGGSQYRGPYAGRDQNVGNDNRQGSDGPIDSHAGDCRDATTCQPADAGTGG